MAERVPKIQHTQNQIHSFIRTIENKINSNVDHIDNTSFDMGLPGIALFYYYYYILTNENGLDITNENGDVLTLKL